jgi:cytochrome c5
LSKAPTLSAWAGVAIAALLAATTVNAQSPKYAVGRTPTQQEIQAWDISIAPDGTGLPPGEGNAEEGARVYETRCQECHGPEANGADEAALVGGHDTLATEKLHFGFFQRKRLSVFTANGEFVTYAVITVVATALLVLNLMVRSGAGLGATRPALFQVVSIMTTTGFGTADYVLWGFGAQVVLFALMVVGGSAGSTAGGMKVIRTLLFGKHILRLIRKQIQPQGVFTVKHAGKPVTNDVMMYVLGFIPFYILVAVVVALVVEAMGVAPSTAFGASIATLSNVGPGFGQVGPTSTYAPLPEAAKVILAFGMLLGRLELFTVLVVLTPMFWKRR